MSKLNNPGVILLGAILVSLLISCNEPSDADKSREPVSKTNHPENDKPSSDIKAQVETSEKKTEIEVAAKSPSKTTTASTIPDFAAIKDVKQKKKQFFAFMLERIRAANEDVLTERANLLKMIARYPQAEPFDDVDSEYFLKLTKKYRVNNDNYSLDEKFTRLKDKIDKVPASLILAQSANESAWGTSRFAKKGNNFFGQWCFSKDCGLVPSARDSGSTHEVAVFSSVRKSVDGYIYNINVGRAYKKVRELRAKMRAQDTSLDSLQLATGLEKYSERGKEYVKEIQSMIRFNKLKEYDLPISETK